MKSRYTLAALTLSLLGTAAIAMPEGSMMGDHMSPKVTKMKMKCEKMGHNKAMKNKHCADMMKHDAMGGSMMGDDAMKHDNMAPDSMKH
jgi:hypothetical protein